MSPGHVERYIIAHKADYYRLLLVVTRDSAWEPWVLYMLTAGKNSLSIRR